MIDHKYTEQAFPWFGAAAASVLVYWHVPDLMILKSVRGLTGPLIDISAIAFGFMMAIAAMLISLESKPAIQALRGIGAYSTLLMFLKAALYSWILVCVCSATLVLIDEASSNLRIYVSLWAALVAFAFLSTFRISRVMFTLLSLPNSRPNRSDSSRPRLAASGQ